MISIPTLRCFRRVGLVLAAITTFLTLPLKAEIIQLINGDHYRGTVVSMTASNVEFISEIQGRVILPRSKVAQIILHEVAVRPVSRTNVAPVAAPLILSGPSTPTAAATATQAAVIQQMQQQGVPPQLVNQVQEQIFGQASPEAAQKFNETLASLMSGKMTVQDLRVQAQDAIKQVRSVKQEAGGEGGDMLDGYLAILEKFVAETTPTSTIPTPQPAATPSATK